MANLISFVYTSSKKVSQLQALLRNLNLEYQGLKGELATLKEVLDKSRKELAEAESRKTELTRIAQKAARERRSAEEAAKLLQAQLHQKESELSRSQDEIEAAKAANDAEEEARKLNSEKQGLLEASMALQMNQTELEDKAELMQKELNAAEAECEILRQVQEARVQEDHQKVVQRAGFIEDLSPALEQKGASEK